jgi:hypothetical protein
LPFAGRKSIPATVSPGANPVSLAEETSLPGAPALKLTRVFATVTAYTVSGRCDCGITAGDIGDADDIEDIGVWVAQPAAMASGARTSTMRESRDGNMFPPVAGGRMDLSRLPAPGLSPLGRIRTATAGQMPQLRGDVTTVTRRKLKQSARRPVVAPPVRTGEGPCGRY